MASAKEGHEESKNILKGLVKHAHSVFAWKKVDFFSFFEEKTINVDSPDGFQHYSHERTVYPRRFFMRFRHDLGAWSNGTRHPQVVQGHKNYESEQTPHPINQIILACYPCVLLY
ncbi:hypothetical protein CRENBAI_006036 [Crenichthys baileyi]|uniref:Uncharacterized protein n=1 Tax=Crenichthys baileyi TaxID=28760 RepID=A0AAV9RUY7_9TELE